MTVDTDTKPKICAGHYRAFRTPGGIINVYDGKDLIFSLPAGFPLQFVKTVCFIYDEGALIGEQHGRQLQQMEIRNALGLA